MAKSFVEVPQDAIRIRVGDHTEIVAWRSVYKGEKQLSLGKSTQYKEDGDVYTKMAPSITTQVFHQLVQLANGHLFDGSDGDGEAIEAPRRGER